MSRLESTNPGTASPLSTAPADHDIRAAEARVRDQEAHVLRLIVQGAPTQFAEDMLRRLIATAEAMKARRARARMAG